MKFIPLSKGAITLVDDEDYERVMAVGKWQVSDCAGRLYARRIFMDKSESTPSRAVTVSLHTFLTGWLLVDHINGLGLDNRKENLRAATKADNAHNRSIQSNNTSGFKGVYWHPATRRWQARIVVDRRIYSLRYHSTPEEAARVYDKAAIELHGEFARLNFPLEEKN